MMKLYRASKRPCLLGPCDPAHSVCRARTAPRRRGSCPRLTDRDEQPAGRVESAMALDVEGVADPGAAARRTRAAAGLIAQPAQPWRRRSARALTDPRDVSASARTLRARLPRHPKGDQTSMNKTELIDITAEDSGLARDDAAKVIDSMLMTVTDTLTKGEEIAIPGFGKFSAVQRAARTGRNPATGAELEIKAATVPKFTAGAGLKAAVNASNN